MLVRQRPGTAKGITFVTIEDETGVANLIVRMDVWEKFHSIAPVLPRLTLRADDCKISRASFTFW